MTKQVQICPACNRATYIVWVHSHGFCDFCKTVIDPCCSGETAEREGGGSSLKEKINNYELPTR